jgi:hypothetical protein
MRRYNGKVSASDKNDENTDLFTHVPQEYGIRIQQSVRESVTKETAFDLPSKSDIACFENHPAFANYKIEQTDGAVRLRLSIKQKAILSSFSQVGKEQEITLTIFPL